MQKFSTRLQKIEEALKVSLPIIPTGEWQKKTFGNIFSGTEPSYFEELVNPCNALVASGGKRWRPLLLVLCAENAASKNTARISEKDVYSLTPLVEFVHTASLIHDDIEDSSDTRRGQPATHITYGLDVAINSGSWLYFMASECINSVPKDARLALYELYAQELRRLHLGQAMDIFWHKNKNVFPSVQSYKAMVRYKTGTLASLAAKVGTFAGGGSKTEIENAGLIASELGEAFQILDDVQNLTTGNPGKKRGDDIVEGKKSLPVLLHIEKCPEDKIKIARFFEDAHVGGIDSPAIEQCINLLQTSQTIEAAYQKGKELVQKKSAELAAMYNGESGALIVDLFLTMLSKVEKSHA
ncbi:MAG: polyprenyl synthetase family protein [Treponema sp.]|nr:polyprenyl synthetase family protein [Treponema sp.]